MKDLTIKPEAPPKIVVENAKGEPYSFPKVIEGGALLKEMDGATVVEVKELPAIPAVNLAVL